MFRLLQYVIATAVVLPAFAEEEGIDYEAGRQFWAFQPIGAPAAPEVRNATWPVRTLDHFVLAKIEAGGRQPTRRADRRPLIRRAYLDLHGLPPSADEIEAFLLDNRPDAWARLIDELLASPRYGERWARHWLDVARYSDSNGMDENIAHPTAWRYRDYVIKSFNDDKPFDDFVVEQLAGDLLPAENLQQRRAQTVGVGFLSVGPKMLACDDPDKMRRDIVDEQLDTTGRAFLGMTIGCARCHDHNFDPISAEDYYGMAGIFMSTKTLTKYSVVAKIHSHDLSSPEDKERRRKIAELEKRKKDKATPEDEKKELEAEIAELGKGLEAPYLVFGPTEYPAQDMQVHLRGDYQTLGKPVPRRLLAVIAGRDQPPMPEEQSGRLEMARWIASKDNPLTARVITNRLWRWHFGRGIVPTPDNFGKLGEPPTHPELLDHLARTLLDADWSLKALHREIMLSATYRQSAHAEESLVDIDPENKLIARWVSRRVESEVVRDAILLKSGRLDLGSNGPKIQPRKKGDGYAENNLKEDAKATCRTVYLPVMRSSGYEDQNAFDFPDPATIDGNRRTSTVAPQSLFLMNSDLVHESSAALAAQLIADVAVDDLRARTSWLIRRVLGRPATEAELARGEDFVAGYAEGDEAAAWAAFARALFASNEFLYIE